MSYNKQHYITFNSLLQLWGLPPEIAQPISNQLAYVDNNNQDELIKILIVALHEKQSPKCSEN